MDQAQLTGRLIDVLKQLLGSHPQRHSKAAHQCAPDVVRRVVISGHWLLETIKVRPGVGAEQRRSGQHVRVIAR